MSLFKKKPREGGPVRDAAERVAIPDTDWADPEIVRAEWRKDTEPPNDRRAAPDTAGTHVIENE